MKLLFILVMFAGWLPGCLPAGCKVSQEVSQNVSQKVPNESSEPSEPSEPSEASAEDSGGESAVITSAYTDAANIPVFSWSVADSGETLEDGGFVIR